MCECVADLRRCGIYQWDKVCPNPGVVARDVADRTLYVALFDGRRWGRSVSVRNRRMPIAK